MGLFSAIGSLFSSHSKSNSTATNSSTATTTPTVPAWESGGLQNVGQHVLDLFNLDPTSLVAPANDYLNLALNTAAGRVQHGGRNGFMDGAEGAISAANSATTPMVTASDPGAAAQAGAGVGYQNINQYMDPFIQQVLDAHYADIDHQAAQADAKAKSDAASAGAWSGNGSDVLRGIINGNYSRDKATTGADLRAHGWDTAVSASGQDASRATEASIANANSTNDMAKFKAQLEQEASTTNAASHNAAIDRYLQSAGLLTNLGNLQSGNETNNLNTLGNLATTAQGIDQSKAEAPATLASLVATLFGGLPLGLEKGSTTTASGSSTGNTSGSQSPSFIDTLMKAAQAAAMFAG